MKWSLSGVVVCLLAIAIASWPGLAEAAPDASAFFEKKVRPILAERCFSCHGPEKQRGNLRLDARAALLAGGDRGAAIVPGKPEESLLLRALSHGEKLKMPPRSKLPAAEVAAIREWVRLGAPWPMSTETIATPTSGERRFTDEEKAFWAFQPITPPQVPTVRHSRFLPRNPIDRFILARLQKEGWQPAPEADRRTLLRRLTFDLTGLPPTVAEIDAFVEDHSPDAYSRVVDRLLASPAYGERWGRRWLDIARYADSNGMDENLAYTKAWRYRDWVIRSFNRDLPYDAFVQAQIAGDLMPGGTAEEQADRLTATGFLVIGPKMLAEDDPVKMRMDIIDEQLDTIGQAFMGLTLGCARCHDHKFDPVTMADYYGLAGILYSTKTMQNHSVVAVWNERPLATAEVRAALAEHEKKLAAAKEEVIAAEKEAMAATVAVLAHERKRAAEYLAAATEVHRRRGPLALAEASLDRGLPQGSIPVEAESYARGNVLKLTDGYGAGIGVIINAGKLPNFTEYDVEIGRAGTYQLAVRYAAAASRPCRIKVNGRLIAGEACGATTGSWFPDKQKWAAEAVVALPRGKAVVRFERDGPFPHLDRFALLPMTTEQAADTPLTVEQAAGKGKLLASVLRAWVEVIGKQKGKAPTGAELERIVDAEDGPFRITAEVQAETQRGQREKLAQLGARVAALEKARPPVPEVMAVEDGKGENLRIHLRGSHLTLGEEAPRRLPRIIAGDMPLSLDSSRSGRLELAKWLTRPDHPLTARVMVNRIWAGHFGAGLVRSPDNFGRLGERPTHPELLTWLAAELVRSGWSIKQMHRLIVTSGAYRMSSKADPEILQKDPDNRLLSHFSRRRLEAEEVRDSMLAVAGLLDRAMGGTLLTVAHRKYVTGTGNKNYRGYDHNRRSVYLPVIRSAVYDVLQTLDFPDPSVPNGRRSATTIPAQALLMLNSTLADQTAEELARSLLAEKGEDGDRIGAAYLRVLGRAPDAGEVARVVGYLKQSEEAAGAALPGEARRLRAWRGLCRVLLASNEMMFVE